MIKRLIKFRTVYTGEKERAALKTIIHLADRSIAKDKYQIEKELGPIFEKDSRVFLSEVKARLRHLEDINAISSFDDFYAILEGKTPKPKIEDKEDAEKTKKENPPEHKSLSDAELAAIVANNDLLRKERLDAKIAEAREKARNDNDADLLEQSKNI